MEVKNIGIIGRSALGTALCDGQTIKTQILISELKNEYPQSGILIVDTLDYKKRFINIIFDMINTLLKSDVIFVLLSRNGMKYLFPVINFINFFLKKPILHDCIGGSLDELVIENAGLKKNLNKFNVNWVESRLMKERLESLGVINVEYLPNFKRLVKSKMENTIIEVNPFKFCTFSRVNETKGIGRAAEEIIKVNLQYGYKRCTLDIYGPIEDNYDKKIQEYVEESNGAIRYMGVVKYSDSVEVLHKYCALLFPTTHTGEGFPGTLIDCFYAGVPIIATDWHLNKEIISDGVTGYIYDVNDENGLRECILKIMSDDKKLLSMKNACLNEADNYSADKVMKQIVCKVMSL